MMMTQRWCQWTKPLLVCGSLITPIHVGQLKARCSMDCRDAQTGCANDVCCLVWGTLSLVCALFVVYLIVRSMACMSVLTSWDEQCRNFHRPVWWFHFASRSVSVLPHFHLFPQCRIAMTSSCLLSKIVFCQQTKLLQKGLQVVVYFCSQATLHCSEWFRPGFPCLCWDSQLHASLSFFRLSTMSNMSLWDVKNVLWSHYELHIESQNRIYAESIHRRPINFVTHTSNDD